MKFDIKMNVLCLMFLGVFLFALSGCKTMGKSGDGIAVEMLMPPDMDEWSGCGNPSLILVDVDKSNKRITKRQNAILLQKSKERLSEVPYFTLREMVNSKAGKGVDEVVAPHHFLTFKVDLLEVVDNSDETDLYKTVNLAISATMKKSNGDDSYTNCGTKSFMDSVTSQAPAYDKADFPSNAKMTYMAMDSVVDMVARQISPKRIHIYRPLRTGGEGLSRVAKFIDSGNCDIALDALGDTLSADQKNTDALYDVGVAYECMARKSISEDERLNYLARSNAVYRKAIALGDDSEDLLKAASQVKQSLSLYAKGKSKAKMAQDKLRDNGPLEFMGTIE
ncbi:hypothetical protein [Maridesulfovibrio sp.]|uniref:hypothetical protein n=1 Tax=Maridesulfovibrio sp. TaxID=2795000 RepID=UPI0029CA0D9A|nr:hypothetical protein [Maridesulfovibrio sp.]